MKKWKTLCIFLLLFATWLALSGLPSRTPWQMFSPAIKDAGIVVPLGEMAGRNYDRMGFEGGEILCVPSAAGWWAPPMGNSVSFPKREMKSGATP